MMTTRKRVLIIDDEAGFTRLLKLNLHQTGRYTAEAVNDPTKAIGAARDFSPDVILLDEPTTGLDPRSQVEFIDLIVDLRKAGKTIITATHDLGIIQDISDRTVVFGEDRRIILDDTPWEVLKNTDMLLRANLMHKHPHRHSWYVHEHSHTGLHEHEHIPELTPAQSSPAKAPETAEGMPEIEKLRILIKHWGEHNHEHAETYIHWAEKAGTAGEAALEEMLKEIAAETKKIDALFEEARKEIAD